MVDVYKAADECVQGGHLSFVFLFSEHPEDLGRVRREEDGWELDPATIWQFEMVRNLLRITGLQLFTLVFHQCCFGASYRKPTDSHLDKPLACSGTGGLKAGRTSWTLARKSNEEGFRTSATSAYPPEMDRQLALAIATATSGNDSSEVGQVESSQKPVQKLEGAKVQRSIPKP